MAGSTLQEQVQAASTNSSRDSLTAPARPGLPASPPTSEGDAAAASNRRAPPIRDLLHAQGIVMRDYSPGQKPHMTCPQCAGGSSGEASLAVVVSDDSRGAAWLCHRGSCGWKGAVNASSGDQLADLLESSWANSKVLGQLPATPDAAEDCYCAQSSAAYHNEPVGGPQRLMQQHTVSRAACW